MNESIILLRALYQTIELIEKEKEINERFIKNHGKENSVTLYRIKKYEEEGRYLYDRIMELENEK